MFWIILIVLGLILIIYWSKNSDSDNSDSYKKPDVRYSNSKADYTNVKKGFADNSIIDITGSTYTIRNENLTKSEYTIPSWKHQYVYSYSEINGATNEQRIFYDFFKSRFLNGVYLDVDGNSNYYFVLLFDLLEDYERHKNIRKLEAQMDNISKYYPKTKPYAKRFLMDKMQAVGFQEGIDRINSNITSVKNYYSNNFEYEYQLGKKYKDRLNLSPQEISWLNKISNPTNVFLDIEFCLIVTMRLYLVTLKSLNNQFKHQNTTIPKEVELIINDVQIYYSKNYNSYWGSYDKSYLKKKAENEIFSTIFKRAENIVREHFYHKRKVSDEFPYNDEKITNEFESRIGSKVNMILKENTTSISNPDEKAEIELNALNPTRWKITFDKLVDTFTKEDIKQFVEGILTLEKYNIKNTSIEHIFYEASKFISKYDRVQSLKYYIQYVHYDLKSERLDNKEMTKTIQKSLFSNIEQLHEFESILASFLIDRNTEKALESVTKLYQPKRKKIIIDEAQVTEVQKQDRESVQILSEYLTDDYEDENMTLKSTELNKEELKIEISSKIKVVESISKLSFPDIQLATIELFKRNSYNLPFIEIESFCQTHGVLRNQLIDSINEKCYELLDDLLIEEGENSLNMNDVYYNKVIQS